MQQEVECIIRRMQSTTSAMDPFPTGLVKANIDAIGPLITSVTNLSLQAVNLPQPLKLPLSLPASRSPL